MDASNHSVTIPIKDYEELIAAKKMIDAEKNISEGKDEVLVSYVAHPGGLFSVDVYVPQSAVRYHTDYICGVTIHMGDRAGKEFRRSL